MVASSVPEVAPVLDPVTNTVRPLGLTATDEARWSFLGPPLYCLTHSCVPGTAAALTADTAACPAGGPARLAMADAPAPPAPSPLSAMAAATTTPPQAMHLFMENPPH